MCDAEGWRMFGRVLSATARVGEVGNRTVGLGWYVTNVANVLGEQVTRDCVRAKCVEASSTKDDHRRAAPVTGCVCPGLHMAAERRRVPFHDVSPALEAGGTSFQKEMRDAMPFLRDVFVGVRLRCFW